MGTDFACRQVRCFLKLPGQLQMQDLQAWNSQQEFQEPSVERFT